MLNKLEEVADRFREVEGLLSDPAVINDQNRYRALTKEHSDLSDVVNGYQEYCRITEEISGSQELLKDPDADVREMASAEVAELEEEQGKLEAQLKLMLLPKDPNDQRNVILEVRAGTGGDEAALFAGDLFRMYCRYADRQRWKVELLSSAESEAGGSCATGSGNRGPGAHSYLCMYCCGDARSGRR
jgi:peptide chain release factor 1